MAEQSQHAHSRALPACVAAGLAAAVVMLTTCDYELVAASPLASKVATNNCRPDTRLEPDIGHAFGFRTRATRLSAPQPVGPWLRQLGAQLSGASCDRAPGKFALIHYIRWVGASRGKPQFEDVTRWRADDASGAEVTVQHSPVPAQVRHRYWRSGDLIESGVGDPFAHTDYLWWEIAPARPGAAQSDKVIQRLADLATWYSPRTDGRRAALAVISDTNGLTYYARVTDRVGRRGVGITATSAPGGTRHLLILQPTTGEFLAYEVAQRTGSAWRTAAYVLFLSHSHSEHRYWEPARPSHVAPPLRQYLYPRMKRRWIDQSPQPCVIQQPTTGASAGRDAEAFSRSYNGGF